MRSGILLGYHKHIGAQIELERVFHVVISTPCISPPGQKYVWVSFHSETLILHSTVCLQAFSVWGVGLSVESREVGVGQVCTVCPVFRVN